MRSLPLEDTYRTQSMLQTTTSRGQVDVIVKKKSCIRFLGAAQQVFFNWYIVVFVNFSSRFSSFILNRVVLYLTIVHILDIILQTS